MPFVPMSLSAVSALAGKMATATLKGKPPKAQLGEFNELYY